MCDTVGRLHVDGLVDVYGTVLVCPLHSPGSLTQRGSTDETWFWETENSYHWEKSCTLQTSITTSAVCVYLLLKHEGPPPSVQSSQCAHVFFSQGEVKDLHKIPPALKHILTTGFYRQLYWCSSKGKHTMLGLTYSMITLRHMLCWMIVQHWPRTCVMCMLHRSLVQTELSRQLSDGLLWNVVLWTLDLLDFSDPLTFATMKFTFVVWVALATIRWIAICSCSPLDEL